MNSPRSAGRTTVVVTLGLLQILAWGSSFYLLAILAAPIAAEMGWSLTAVIAGLSLGMLCAGVVSPFVGRTINARGGRVVLAASSLVLAGGLFLLGFATTLPLYYIAWSVIGLGMGAGLYDPAFATLGRVYGLRARPLITIVTLFGGFANTVAWPAIAYLLEHVGWRDTCLIFAAAHLVVGFPAYLLLLPKASFADLEITDTTTTATAELPEKRQRVAFLLVAVIVTLGAAILSLMSTHIVSLLQTRGFDLAAAVALGAVIGPAQVAARVLELAFGRRLHPTWIMFAGTLLLVIGLVLLWAGWGAAAIGIIAYGAGNGIGSVVRGTVPLVLFGPSYYAINMGRLALPILLAMAIAPSAGALFIESGGVSLAFAALSAMALVSCGFALALALLVSNAKPAVTPAARS